MQRYSRQIILSEIGESGQKKLSEASVLIVGAGGLGSPAAIYLASAGVGKIIIADADEVRLHNLNRQILYNEEDLGKSKSVAAVQNLKKFNSGIKLQSMGRIDAGSLDKILSKDISVVIDGTDNFETRYLINDACASRCVPFVYGSALGWIGQTAVFDAKNGPCYSCVFPEPPLDAPTCVRAGVIGIATGVIGILEADEAIKSILGQPTLLGKMLLVNLLKSEFKTVLLEKDPNCPSCS